MGELQRVHEENYFDVTFAATTVHAPGSLYDTVPFMLGSTNM